MKLEAGLDLRIARVFGVCFIVFGGFHAPAGRVKAEDAAAPGVNRGSVRIDPDYRIGAYYFGYWGPHFPRDQIEHYEKKFGGKADWWAGVRDLHDSQAQHAPSLYKGDFRHLKPLLGYYDLSDRSVVEAHIRQALSYGLSYFSFYFYWDAAVGDEKYGDGLASFLSASNRDEIGLMLSIVARKDDLAIPRADFERVANHLADRYVSLPRYLTAAGGQPIVELLGGDGLGDGSAGDVDAFVSRLREAIRRRSGTEMKLLVNTAATNFTGIAATDGYSCSDNFWFPEGLVAPVKPYEDYIRNIDLYFDRVRGAIDGDKLFHCVSSGHDERPRLYLNTQANSAEEVEKIRRLLPYYSDRSPRLFRAALRRVKARMDASAGPWRRYLTIYAWNEWNEGGIIEPNVSDGAAYLAAVAEVFSARARRGAGKLMSPR